MSPTTIDPPVSGPTSPAGGAAGGPSTTVERLRAAADAGEPTPADLRDLSGQRLVGADLSGLDLSGCDLSGADLSRANLGRTRLLGANLSDATLFEAILEDAECLSANLSGANLCEARAARIGLGAADLRGAVLSRGDLSGATLTKADLSGADLRGTTLSGARVREAQLTDADLARARLDGADLERSDVSRANFADCNMRGARLRGVRGYATTNWIEADINDVDFCGAYLVRRTIMDQNYLHEFREFSRFNAALYQVWWITSDCGRSFLRWGLWTVFLAAIYAGLYEMVEIDYGSHPTPLSSIYYSVVTLTTLGYGDVLPASSAAQLLAMSQVILGYVMLGGLLSIFSNKMARRAD